MSTTLRPALLLPIQHGQRRVGFLAAFTNDEWESEGWRPGLYRVMTGPKSWNAKGSAWWRRPGETHSFLDLEGVLALHCRLVRRALGAPEEEPAPYMPDLPKGSRVRVKLGEDISAAFAQAAAENPGDRLLAAMAEPGPVYRSGFTLSEPFQDEARQWFVRVRVAEGSRTVRCGECEVVW